MTISHGIRARIAGEIYTAPFTPASAIVGTAGIAGDRATLVTVNALI